MGLPMWCSSKESTCQCRRSKRLGSIPSSGRSLGVGNSNLLQCSCLEDSVGRGAWQLTVHGVAKSQTQLSTHTHALLSPFSSLKLPVYTNAVTSVSTFYSSLLGKFMPSIIYAAAAAKSLQACPTLCDPTRLLCPWDSPGKNTGVGCHFLLQYLYLLLNVHG